MKFRISKYIAVLLFVFFFHIWLGEINIHEAAKEVKIVITYERPEPPPDTSS